MNAKNRPPRLGRTEFCRFGRRSKNCCLGLRLLHFALARKLEYYDSPAVRKIVRDAAASDYRWSSIILGIVKSPTFLMRETQLEPAQVALK